MFHAQNVPLVSSITAASLLPSTQVQAPNIFHWVMQQDLWFEHYRVRNDIEVI